MIMNILDMSSSPQQHQYQYPEEIQVKLYEAFIFSIPILFSIILFLLFYLFYLKRRRASSLLPTTIQPTLSCDSDLKVKNKLCQILFDHSMDSMCCVCLGEFEVKEELLQVPTCSHIFHIDCIHYWLQNNSTCPLCRAPVVSDSGHHQPPPEVAVMLPPEQMLQLQHNVVSHEGSSSATGRINAC